MYKGLQFRNEGEKTVEIDIEGSIGGSFWETDKEENKNTKEKMKAELKKLSNLKAETIIVNINSLGGCVNHALSIHDLLAENPAKVITKINGMTASAATLIAMAGDERKISDNSLFLAHRASTWAMGNINDINTVADDLKKVDDRIINIYCKTTGKPKEEITELMDRANGNGQWITAEEAKEYGFVTEVFEPKKMAAFFSNDILNAHHLPSLPENLIIQPVIEEKEPTWLNKIMDKIDDVFTKQTQINSKTMHKDFTFINKALNIEGFESTDGKNFNLTIEDLKAINSKLEEIAKAQEEATTSKDALTNATKLLDGIDESVKTAETIEKKVEAITKKLAEKPSQSAAQNLGEDAHHDVDGVDWNAINNLEHNKGIE